MLELRKQGKPLFALAFACLAMACVMLLAAGGARAGTYEVLSCAAAPAGGADDAWVAYGDAPEISSVRACPPDGGLVLQGLLVHDVLGGLESAPGNERGWRFDAPPGTVVTRLEYTPRISKYEEMWTAEVATAEGDVLDTCHVVAGEGGSCFVGSARYASEPQRPEWVHGGLNTTGLVARLRCDAPAGGVCLNGGSQSYGNVGFYLAAVTVSDAAPPVIQSVDGELVDSIGGQVVGSRAVRIRATSQTGVRAARIYLDGALVTEVEQGCDYSRAVPCPETPLILTLDSARFANGSHLLEFAAVDGANNEIRTAAQQIEIANPRPPEVVVHPPAPPVGPGNQGLVPGLPGLPILPAPDASSAPSSPAPGGSADRKKAVRVTPKLQLRLGPTKAGVRVSSELPSNASGSVTITVKVVRAGKVIMSSKKKVAVVNGRIQQAFSVGSKPGSKKKLPLLRKGSQVVKVTVTYGGDARYLSRSATRSKRIKRA